MIFYFIIYLSSTKCLIFALCNKRNHLAKKTITHSCYNIIFLQCIKHKTKIIVTFSKFLVTDSFDHGTNCLNNAEDKTFPLKYYSNVNVLPVLHSRQMHCSIINALVIQYHSMATAAFTAVTNWSTSRHDDHAILSLPITAVAIHS